MNQQPHLRLIVCPHSLSPTRDRIDVLIPPGATVAEHLRTIGCDTDRLTALVYLDERLVPRAEWESAVPQAGQSLAIQAIPAGGDDRGGGKSILAIAALFGLLMANQFSRSGQSSFPGPYFGILPDMISRMVSGGNVARAMLSGGLLVSPLGGLLGVMALIPTLAGSDLPAGSTRDQERQPGLE
jgi:sulfur carrier protein ThiS